MEECLKHVRTRMELDLYPSKLSNVQAGVYELLNEMLLRYDEGLEGVVLAVGRPQILSHEAEVQPYFPLCRVKLNVPLVLFRPHKGAVLTGCVTQLGPDFVGMLVAGVINASVAKAEMHTDWFWHREAQEWHRKGQPGHVISVQSYVRFVVTSIERTDVFFGIKGSLMTKTTGAAAFLATLPAPDTAKTGKKDKKDKSAKKDKSTKKDKSAKKPADTDTTLVAASGRKALEPALEAEAGKGQSTGKKEKKRPRQADTENGGGSGGGGGEKGQAEVPAGNGVGVKVEEGQQEPRKKKSKGGDGQAGGQPGTSNRTDATAAHTPAASNQAAGTGGQGTKSKHKEGQANGVAGHDEGHEGSEGKKKKKKKDKSHKQDGDNL